MWVYCNKGSITLWQIYFLGWAIKSGSCSLMRYVSSEIGCSRNKPGDSLTGNSLTNRYKLDKRLGFWLDYWLFLHSDTTHRLWAARPFGIRAIIRVAKQSEGDGNEKLRHALKEELNDWLDLVEGLDFIKCLPPPSRKIDQGGANWEENWNNWFDAVLVFLSSSRDLEHQLIRAISIALWNKNYKRVMYLTRGLAAELGGDGEGIPFWQICFLGWAITSGSCSLMKYFSSKMRCSRDGFTARQLFRSAKNSLCDSGSYNDSGINFLKKEELEKAIKSALLGGTESRYQVEIEMSKVVIRRQLWKKVTRSIAKENARNLLLGESCELEGFSLNVSAVHPEQALVKSLKIATAILADLKQQHPDKSFVLVKTKSVVNLDTGESEPEQGVPKLPNTIFRHKTQGRYNDMKSASSQPGNQNFAANWIENPHKDCIEIWATLEGYSSESPDDDKLQKVLSYTKSSLDYLPEEMLKYLASRLSSQYFALEQSHLFREDKQWQFWDSKNKPLSEWENKVFNEQSKYFYENWLPTPPLLLFDSKVGLLHKMRDDPRSPNVTEERKYMEKIWERNLRLLYGLRNKLQHGAIESRQKFKEAFPDDMARYLGRFALETLFIILNKQGEEETLEQKQAEQLRELQKKFNKPT